MRKSFVYFILGIFTGSWLIATINLYINGTQDVLGNQIYGLEAVLAWWWAYVLSIVMLASAFGIAIGIVEKLGKNEANDALFRLIRRIVLLTVVVFSAVLGLSSLMRP